MRWEEGAAQRRAAAGAAGRGVARRQRRGAEYRELLGGEA